MREEEDTKRCQSSKLRRGVSEKRESQDSRPRGSPGSLAAEAGCRLWLCLTHVSPGMCRGHVTGRRHAAACYIARAVFFFFFLFFTIGPVASRRARFAAGSNRVRRKEFAERVRIHKRRCCSGREMADGDRVGRCGRKWERDRKRKGV